MSGHVRLILFALLALLLAAATACGAAEEDESYDDSYAAPAPTPMAITGSDASFTTNDDRQVDATAGEDPRRVRRRRCIQHRPRLRLPPPSPPKTASSSASSILTLEVDDVSERMDDVAAIAARRSGWVVAESRYSKARRQHLDSRAQRPARRRRP